MKPSLTIGIAGGTGSGKTTLARRIAEAFAPGCLLISHDNYYRSREDLSYEERTHLNYDHPDSLDTELLCTHLRALQSGQAVDIPTYDFTHHLRSENTLHCESAPILVVEGLLILDSAPLRKLLDLKLFVDTDDDVRFIRRLTRDTTQRGRSMESVIDQYLSTVKPMHDRFVVPSRRFADVIIPEGGENRAALELVAALIRQKLDRA